MTVAHTFLAAFFLLLASSAAGAAEQGAEVRLPGLSYHVLASGPADGAQPTRADSVAIRYVGRLTNGTIFSTSADNGSGATSFDVRTVIPGFSALVQLMRPGDRWRMTIPGYLAYGRTGKRFTPGDPTMKQDVPPDSTLIFDTELVSVTPKE